MSKQPNYVFDTDELYHHGILGQKWGVRRWQNDDGSLTSEGYEHYGYGKSKNGPPEKESYVLKKGSTVNRISIHKDEKIKGSKYLYTDVDKDVYEGAFAKYQKYAHGDKAPIYKKTYEITQDLIAPSDKKAMEIVNERLKDKKVSNRVNSFTNTLIYNNHPLVENILKENKIKVDHKKDGYDASANAIAKIKNEKVKEKIKNETRFAAYNLMVENDKKELNKLLKNVSKQGYNAIMDYNNVKVYNDAAEPFITINSKKTLKQIDNKLLEDKYIEDSINRLQQKMKKKGKNVVL